MKLEAEITCPVTFPIPLFMLGMELSKKRENKILNES